MRRSHRSTWWEPLDTHLVIIAAVLAAAVLVIALDIGFGGPILHLDRTVDLLAPRETWPAFRPAADLFDHIGQRSVLLPPLFAVAVVLAWRRRRLEPVAFAVVASLAASGVVGVLKLATGRLSPRVGGPSFFHGGILFPSGHTTNIILAYGAIAYLVAHYARPAPRWWLPVGAGGTATIETLMTACSLYRQTHWLSDLVAGAFTGGSVLILLIVVDRHADVVLAWSMRIVRAGLRPLRGVRIAGGLPGRAGAAPPAITTGRVLATDPVGPSAAVPPASPAGSAAAIPRQVWRGSRTPEEPGAADDPAGPAPVTRAS